MEKKSWENVLATQDFDITKLLAAIERNGAGSFKILQEDFRKKLLKESDYQPFTFERDEIITKNNFVKQRVLSVDQFNVTGSFQVLARSFDDFLEEQLGVLSKYPFATRLKFNDFQLRKYPPGSVGISPHIDSAKFINLICNFVLTGDGKFYISDDRFGRNMREIFSEPGSVVIMRAPGFMSSNKRPYHSVGVCETERISFGLRQMKD